MNIFIRKQEHIDICLEKDIGFKKITSGFEKYELRHNALPEIDFEEIDTTTYFLEKKLGAPIYISPITGGIELAKTINKNLACVAQKFNLPIGCGSQRAALEDPFVRETFETRKYAPDIPIFANLGAVQLNYGYGITNRQVAIKMIEADTLVLHLNPLQEVIQNEGNINFSNLLKKFAPLRKNFQFPSL